MPWTHFTSYLDGSRPITRAERDELFSQLDAKLGDCSTNLSLDAATLAAVTASRLLTDRTTLLDESTAIEEMERLETVIDAAQDNWHNYATVRAAALSAESIDAAGLTAILDARIDDHRLWNYYRRLIDGLSCYCPEPAIEVQNRGASSDLYGYLGFTRPTPLKRYRTTVSRGWGELIGPLLAINDVHCSRAPLAGAAAGACLSQAYNAWDLADMPPAPANLEDESDTCAGGFFSFEDTGSGGTVVSDSHLLADLSDPDSAARGHEHLLNEITLDAFLAEVLAAARAASWADADPEDATAYSTKSGNVDGFAVSLARIRFRFALPETGNYRVNWKVIWTPRTWSGSAWVAGTPEVYEEASWVWDGEEPEGYDAENSATWPVSPWFELPDPTSDGAYTIADVVCYCDTPPAATAPAAVGGYGV